MIRIISFLFIISLFVLTNSGTLCYYAVRGAAVNTPLRPALDMPSKTHQQKIHTTNGTPSPDNEAKSAYLPLVLQALEQATMTPTSPTATPMSPVTATITPPAAITPTVTPTVACQPLADGAITYVALGDSLTQGDGDETEQRGFTGRLLVQFQALRTDSTLTNLGHSGWTSDNLINGLDQEPSELSQAIAQLNQAKAAHQPNIATVWIGSNDLWYLYEYANPTAADEAQDLQHFTTNLDTILRQLRSTGAVTFIALLDDQSKRPVATAHQAFPGTSAAELALMAQQVTRYNNAISAKAAQYGATAVDFFHTTFFTDPATLADDGNHPNAHGYDLIAQQWFAAMQGWLSSCQATAIRH